MLNTVYCLVKLGSNLQHPIKQVLAEYFPSLFLLSDKKLHDLLPSGFYGFELCVDGGGGMERG